MIGRSSNSDDVSASSNGGDYRSWHMNQGPEYDAYLGRSPLDAYMAAREGELVPQIVSRLFPAGVPSYLDFACGTGRIISLVEPYARVSIGIDISEKMLAEARPRCPRTTFIVADLTRASVDAGPFDLITGFRFLGNAQHSLRLEALRALRRVLKPGGYLLMNNHRNPWSIQSMMSRGRTETVDLHYLKLRRLYADAGFRIVRTYPIGAWIVRARLAQASVLNSGFGKRLERITSIRALSAISVDYLILAQGDQGGPRRVSL